MMCDKAGGLLFSIVRFFFKGTFCRSTESYVFSPLPGCRATLQCPIKMDQVSNKIFPVVTSEKRPSCIFPSGSCFLFSSPSPLYISSKQTGSRLTKWVFFEVGRNVPNWCCIVVLISSILQTAVTFSLFASSSSLSESLLGGLLATAQCSCSDRVRPLLTVPSDTQTFHRGGLVAAAQVLDQLLDGVELGRHEWVREDVEAPPPVPLNQAFVHGNGQEHRQM